MYFMNVQKEKVKTTSLNWALHILDQHELKMREGDVLHMALLASSLSRAVSLKA